ncbi:MAG: hypothetical protein IKW85_07475 [Muribaculaceae bacterium]|nr:hypothetical protein [Muribaculaceae bacterium]
MKKVTNIRPLEVVEDGNRSVQYKGRDGKMHDIAPTPQQTEQQASPGSGSAEPSVVVGTVTVVDYKPTITLDELLPDRFYRIDSTNGMCLIATSMVDGELNLRVIGNSRQGIDSEIVETIALDEQDRWILTLSGWAANPVMTLLNEHDTITELALNHQSLFEEFLNYTLLGSQTYDNHGGFFGSITATEDGLIICDKDVAGRNGTLTLAIYLGMGAAERKFYKTFRLRNYTATVGSFDFFESNGKLMMRNRTGDIIWGMSVFKLSGVLGTMVEYSDETHAEMFTDNSESWKPKNGDKIMTYNISRVNIDVTINDNWYISESIDFDNSSYHMLEYLILTDYVNTVQDGFSGKQCLVLVDGKPHHLTQLYNNYAHGGM